MQPVRIPDETERLATATVNAAFVVHRTLGPGLLESAYQECLSLELSMAGFDLVREVTLPLMYRNHIVPNAYRLDLIINKLLIVEIKAIEAILPIHRVQLTTYLKLMKLPLGLLINFNVPLIKNGITRVLNLDFRTEPSEPFPARTVASSRLRA